MAMSKDNWLKWAVELQALAQAGLAYTENKYDRERFERIREIAAVKAQISDLSVEIKQYAREVKLCYLFCSSQISSTAISAGLTPETRPACPMDMGRISLSFSLASSRRPAMAL